MTFIVLGFVSSLLFVFALCLLIAHKLTQAKSALSASRERQQQLRLAENDAAWRANQRMILH